MSAADAVVGSGPDGANPHHELVPGMCFPIVPGVHLPGLFGVRVEDIVTVTGTGGRRLNHTPHTLGIME